MGRGGAGGCEAEGSEPHQPGLKRAQGSELKAVFRLQQNGRRCFRLGLQPGPGVRGGLLGVCLPRSVRTFRDVQTPGAQEDASSARMLGSGHG